VYLPGYVALPISNRIVKRNKTTAVQAKNEAKEHKKINKVVVKQQPMFTTTTTIFKQVGNNFVVTPVTVYRDILVFEKDAKPYISNILNNVIKAGAFKTVFRLDINMFKPTNVGGAPSAHSFSSGAMSRYNDSSIPIINKHSISEVYDEIFDIIKERVQEYCNNGSGWDIDQINFIEIKTTKYKPFKGGSYIESPEWIRNKKCCINVKNEDNQCSSIPFYQPYIIMM
jgi:hypothetical protein